MLDLGISNTQAKPLQQRTSEGKNICDVYAGDHHIWPVRNDVVYFYDFDSVQLRFLWTNDDGNDFDTGTNIETRINGIPNETVGWSWGRSESRTQPYLYWGGDNVTSGAECVMVDVGAIKRTVSDAEIPNEVVIRLRGNWYNSRKSGNVTVECTAYKGGVIVKSYMLGGNTVGVTNENYVFADKDGYLPNDFWYGEVVDVDGVCHRVNLVDDTIDGLPDKKVRRTFTVNNVNYFSKDGYVSINQQDYKIWNKQINYNGDIIQAIASEVVDNNGNKQSDEVMLALYKDGTYNRSITSQFLYGYVAGNSEKRGQQMLQANITSQNHSAAAEEFAVVNYYNKTEAGQIVSLNPIE